MKTKLKRKYWIPIIGMIFVIIDGFKLGWTTKITDSFNEGLLFILYQAFSLLILLISIS